MTEALFQNALRLHQGGALEEAARLYAEILQQDPHHFRALYLLGFIHFQNGRFEEAAKRIGEAILLNPAVPDAFYNRGCALQKLHRDDEAVACFDRAVALKPDYAEAFFNRGTSQLHLRAYPAAIASFDAALALAPGDAEAWYNRGAALQGLRRFAEAASAFEKALALAPDLEFAKGKLVYSRLQSCDWRHYDEDKAALAAELRAGKRVAAPLEYMLVSSSPADHQQVARLWMQKEVPVPPSAGRAETYRHRRIRVAYLSADFRDHAVAHQIAGVIEHHDRTHFEIMALSHGPDDGSAMRRRLVAAFDRFTDVRGKSDEEAAELLRAWETDIAVDLTSHTLDGRPSILARRPAPLQVNFLGYPGTMAADFIDYAIADPFVVPEVQRPFFTEMLVDLPDSFMPTDSKRAVAPMPSRAEAGLPEEAVVFCSFNNIAKLSPEMFALWMRLLRAADNSVLWLPEPGVEAVDNLRREAAARDVALERLVFAPYIPTSEAHLARLGLADLFLDTLPYNAHSTASDALWVGVPVLTCIGESFPGRVAASLLAAIGAPELATSSLTQYEETALRLAREPAARRALKEKLARNRDTHPLFDTKRFCRHLESAYATMVDRHRRGEKPAHFSVAPLS